jgi:hypothetical protein
MKLPAPEVLARWPIPNYIDPPTRGSVLDIITIVLLAVTVIVVGLRVYTKLYIVKKFSLDDALIVAAIPPTIAFVVCQMLAQHNCHWSRHIWDIPLPNLLTGRKYQMGDQMGWGLATLLTRLSILFFLRRLFLNSGSLLSKTILFCIWAVILLFIIYFFMFIFQCRYVDFPSYYPPSNATE